MRPRTTLIPALILAVGTMSLGTLPVLAQDVPAPFDSSLVHDISVTYDPTAYDAMIAAYVESGDKEWIEAAVTIDGVTHERAGMRLKGNSSLMSLRGGFGGRGSGTEGPTPGSSPGSSAGSSPGSSADPAQGTDPPADLGGPAGFPSASAEEPERLPWLIRLDRNVDGQAHQGITDLVVRSSISATALNEALALELLEAAGLASQQAAPTSFSVNGGEPVLRLIIENPDDAWMAATFDGAGALYKAESTGDWSYRGDDPDAYDEIFDQEAGEDVADLTPLMDLLEWLETTDDATFAAELPARLDVDAFATYLAMMELVDNVDDIDGPGNNAYLHWDAATGVFTIVPWDMNLAFGAMGRLFGPGGPRPGGPAPGGVSDPDAAPQPGGRIEGFRPGGGGPFGRTNPLVERFRAHAPFEARVQARLEELREALFTSGRATVMLTTWTDVLSTGATDLVDATTITEESAALAAQLAATAAEG